MMEKPRYQQVVESLMEEIERKCANEAILSERDLASVFKISRMTARKAIDCLVDEGYLYRVKNKGTFVADNSLRKNHKIHIATQNTTYRTIYFNVKEVGELDVEIKQKLNIATSELVVIIFRVHLENDIPQCVDEIYFIKKYLSKEDMKTMNSILNLDLYLEKQRVLQSFYPMVVPIKYAKLLHLKQQTPIIKVENVVKNQEGVATLFFTSYLNPNEMTIHLNH